MLDFDYQLHKPLRELVYEQLRHRILTGDFKPGTRMMEVELAQELGVSRTPIREAIRQLEKEGLITIEPRKGAYVSDVSINDLLDILEVRQDLEGLAASLAANRVTKTQLKELEAATKAYSVAIAKNDTENIIKYDEIFHKLIVSSTGNSALMKISETVQDLALRFRYLYYDDFSRFVNMASEHKDILDAIKSGNSIEARKVADEHVNKLKEFVVSEGDHAFKISK